MKPVAIASPSAVPDRPAPGDALAVLLAHTDLRQAASAWVRALAERHGHERVTLGLRAHGDLTVVAVSTPLPLAPGSPEMARLTQALAEALDQAAPVVVPESLDQAHPRITLAHRRLLESRGNPSIVAGIGTVPIVAAGELIGAVCVERGTALSPQDLDTLTAPASAAGPVLRLMQLNQRSLFERSLDALRQAWTRPDKRGVRWAAVAAGVALAALALVPADWTLGGHARLEGTVQRLLVAPADGFLRQVHARPGETVHSGQLLVELADQDLLLEQQRWQSQLQQHENAYAAANARADRAQQVMHQSQAAEAEAQLELVQMKLARGRIEAPFDGIVVQGDLSQQLGAPLAQGAELMTIAPLDQFRVIVEVDERDIAAVAVGQGGTLALSALPWRTLPLRVTRITPIATPVEGNNVFAVEAELLGGSPELRPGLQGTAHIVAGRRSLLDSSSRRLVDGLRLALWDWWGV